VADSVLRRAAEHTWWFTPDERTDRPALALVAGSSCSVLLEAGASPAHARAFLDAVAPLGLPPLRAAVLTHWHWDHSFGAAGLDVPVIAGRSTHDALVHQASLDFGDEALDARVADGTEIAFCRDMLRLEYPDRGALEVVVPHVVFDDRLTLDLGGVTVEVECVGGDHAADACVAWVGADRLLFLGDCLYQCLHTPVEHYTPELLLPLVERIGAFGAAVAIEGHADEAYDAAGLRARLDELRRAALDAGRLGPAALDAAADEDARDLVQLVLDGIGLAARGT
jgi:glyoxylase-like metal-dependent hydrolase (beta-lactamase superfamily II)